MRRGFSFGRRLAANYANAREIIDPIYKEIHECGEVFPHLLSEIEHFFSIYKSLEGKKTEIAGWSSADAARKLISPKD